MWLSIQYGTNGSEPAPRGAVDAYQYLGVDFGPVQLALLMFLAVKGAYVAYKKAKGEPLLPTVKKRNMYSDAC